MGLPRQRLACTCRGRNAMALQLIPAPGNTHADNGKHDQDSPVQISREVTAAGHRGKAEEGAQSGGENPRPKPSDCR